MARTFVVGDNVEFPYWAGMEIGTVESMDREAGSMWIRTGPKTTHSAKWIGGHWRAYRGYKIYRGRIRRVRK